MTVDNNLVYITISIICAWLVLSEIYGKKYVSRFVDSLFPFL